MSSAGDSIWDEYAELVPEEPRDSAVDGAAEAHLNGHAHTQGGDRFELTDLGNAERLVSLYGHDLRHIRAWARWHFWDGQRWAPDETGEVDRLAARTVRSIYKEAAACADTADRKAIAAHARRSESAQRIRAAISLAASHEPIAARPDAFDRDPWALTVANGTLDLRTGRLHPHQRADMNTKLAPVPYDASARCDRWLAFLERVVPCEDVRGFLQRAVGYSLTGDTREQVLFLCWGGGANGKTTFIERLLSMLGEYALKSPAEMLLAKRGDAIPNDVARLRGARFVAMAELEDGRRLAETRVKELTGSDTISARFMRAEFFDFRPVAKLWLCTNHKPVVRGTDAAIWRRIRLVPFDVTIPPEERDGSLPAKLEAELPGILRWAVEGCLAWQRQGLGAPPAVLAATSAYRAEQDVLGAWIEDRCTVVDGAWVPAADLYADFRAWSEANGERPVNQTRFGLELRGRGFVNDRKGHGGKRVWHGIGLAAGGGDG